MNKAIADFQRTLALVLALLGATFCHANIAEDDWYQIEIILFEHQQSDLETLRYEYLDRLLPPSRSDYLHYFTLGKPLSPHHIEALADEERDLLDAYNRLHLDPLTRPVLYYAWRQVLARDERTLPIRIHAGPQYGDHAMFEGYFQVRRNRYTHLAVEVFRNEFITLPYRSVTQWLLESEESRLPMPWLAQPLQIQNGSFNQKGQFQLPVNTVHLSQSRRVKDAEMHYIDHPAMGVIVTIKSVPNPNAELQEFETAL